MAEVLVIVEERLAVCGPCGFLRVLDLLRVKYPRRPSFPCDKSFGKRSVPCWTPIHGVRVQVVSATQLRWSLDAMAPYEL